MVCCSCFLDLCLMRDWDDDAIVAPVGVLHNWFWWWGFLSLDRASFLRVWAKQPVSRTLLWSFVVGASVDNKHA